MDRADRFSSSTLTDKAIETTLNAGEVLYLPTGWWHRIESDPGIALNFWWSPGWWPLIRSTLSGRALRGFMLHIVWRALRLTRKRKPTETLLNAQVSFEGRSAQAKITSLLLSGCVMLADVPLSKGSSVEIKAVLPFPHSDAVEFSMKGVVRNVGPEGIKVDFDTMQAKDWHQLLEFLDASRPPEQRWGAVRLAQ